MVTVCVLQRRWVIIHETENRHHHLHVFRFVFFFPPGFQELQKVDKTCPPPRLSHRPQFVPDGSDGCTDTWRWRLESLYHYQLIKDVKNNLFVPGKVFVLVRCVLLCCRPASGEVWFSGSGRPALLLTEHVTFITFFLFITSFSSSSVVQLTVGVCLDFSPPDLSSLTRF